jgi:hypothetical protein
MKTLSAILLGCLLATTNVLADTNNEADKKWLEVVSSMVSEGQTKVSTPNEQRVTLVKDWAAKNGYSVAVTKVDAGYQIEFTRQLAKNKSR